MAGFSGIRLAAVAALALAACGGSSQTPTTSAHIPGLAGKAAGYDDIEIDQASQVVYVADRTDTGIDVFDVSGSSPKYVRTVTLPDAPNGLAVAHDLGRIYAGTGSGAVEVVDPVAGKVVSEIKTGAKDIDLLDVAPAQGLLFASTGAGGTLLTIDLSTTKVVSTAAIGKPLEQPRFNTKDQLVYVSVPNLDAIVVVDPKTGTVTRTVKLGGCIPRGFGIRPGTNTALVACRKSVMAVDLGSGKSKIVGKVPDADLVQYFPAVDRFFVAASFSTRPSMFGMYGGDPVQELGIANIDGGGAAAVYETTNDAIYTSDGRAGSAGLTGFRMDGSRPVTLLQSALTTGVPVLVFVLVLVVIFWFVGRKADPIHRKQRAASSAPAVVLAKPRVEGPP